ncbi:hypothetical protein U9M48_019002 [Paspalum notatum var. saurae]|uniref:Uncharacterized protein n=1 Tax=Paspalum notatum var. saurae TaxID=547442 RepID=A0AAQ3TE17_PASNO
MARMTWSDVEGKKKQGRRKEADWRGQGVSGRSGEGRFGLGPGGKQAGVGQEEERERPQIRTARFCPLNITSSLGHPTSSARGIYPPSCRNPSFPNLIAPGPGLLHLDVTGTLLVPWRPWPPFSPWYKVSMEKEKWRFLAYILYINKGKKLQNYLELMETLKMHARSFYSEEIEMDDDKFLQMLLLDGCFILVYLYGISGIVLTCQDSSEKISDDAKKMEEGNVSTAKTGTKMTCEAIAEDSKKAGKAADVHLTDLNPSYSIKKDKSVHKEDSFDDCCQRAGSWYISHVAHDLLLLENQIPFFIIKKIYLLVADGARARLLTDNLVKCIEGILYNYPKAIRESERPEDFHHLLHLCHMYFRPSQSVEEDLHQEMIQYLCYFHKFCRRYLTLGNQIDKNHQWSTTKQKRSLLRWRRAEHYHEAGIEFKKRGFSRDSPHSLLDVKFTSGLVEIPLLVVDDKTGYLFRNLIAFERTCPQFGNSVTAYICFISQLISLPKDVTLLAKRGIIVHQMRSDEEVSGLFANLGKNLDFNVSGNNYLGRLSHVMEEHCESRLNRWMAWLWQNHFSNPWLSLAAIAGAIVLFCTILQSLFSLLSFLQLRNDDSVRSNNNFGS